jgi:hypothetical protein
MRGLLLRQSLLRILALRRKSDQRVHLHSKSHH